MSRTAWRASAFLAMLGPAALLSLAPFSAAPAAAAPQARLVRIGLSTDSVRSRITADGGVIVLDPVKRTPIWRKVFDPGLTFVAEVQGKGPLVLYRVQIGSFATEDGANQKKAAIESLLPAEKVVVAYHPDRRSWRVRAGEFRTREEAATLVKRLADEGYNELWIVEDEPETAGRRRVRLVDERWHDFLAATDRVLLQPARSGAWLKVDATPYRGTLEVRVDRAGRIRVINVLELEEYLRGVVPNEMGPGVYPELEALKAQAVAARTYIVSNLGQFADSGYDVCDSAQCQVYKGAGTEHPLTNQAVEETRGLVAVQDGRPINALYTSTCGGHTEDGALIFPEEKGSYLKGVECYPEAEAEGHALTGVEWVEPVTLEDGARVNEEIQMMRLLGIVGNEALDRSWLQDRCKVSEAERWTTYTLGQIGKKPDHEGLRDNRLQLHDYVVYLTRSLGWDEKMRLALDARDLPYLLAFRDRDLVPEEARRAYAELILEGIFDPFPDNTLRPTHEPSR
ncbi:MAG TPA: SpoIID/LytB domain-containing protein, partial [Candidatus Polarisedimenticolia bacterium]|nr:SpoIID/LytB domain-containing protein [Candidatus Polarisedimenticolia bacterium]